MVVLDTHVLIWWINDTSKLTSKAKKAIEETIDSDSRILISCISTWEISMLIRKKRLVLTMDTDSWINEINNIKNIHFCEIDNYIALNSTILPGNFHKDPADRMIVTTARKYSAPLITADEKILSYEHVKTIW